MSKIITLLGAGVSPVCDQWVLVEVREGKVQEGKHTRS